MNVLKVFLFTLVGVVFITNTTFAQETKKADDSYMDDFGMNMGEFPEPAGRDAASLVINLNLDAFGLNAGNNLVHTDRATKTKLLVYLNPYTKSYTISAKSANGDIIPIRFENSDKPGCVFATIGGDWINVLCSDKYHHETADNK